MTAGRRFGRAPPDSIAKAPGGCATDGAERAIRGNLAMIGRIGMLKDDDEELAAPNWDHG
jgi:hypothetical protein